MRVDLDLASERVLIRNSGNVELPDIGAVKDFIVFLNLVELGMSFIVRNRLVFLVVGSGFPVLMEVVDSS